MCGNDGSGRSQSVVTDEEKQQILLHKHENSVYTSDNILGLITLDSLIK